MIRIMIVDDYWTVRQALDRLFTAAEDISTVAQANNGLEAVCLCMQHHPDVVLMDVAMPELDGITATRLIRCLAPDTKVIILSGSTDDAKAHESGAHAYLSKSDPTDRILKTVRTVSQGK